MPLLIATLGLLSAAQMSAAEPLYIEEDTCIYSIEASNTPLTITAIAQLDEVDTSE